uniref:PHB domain-containing protein n=1 Tax=Trichuris muris TaxID=70415 RepID=A0A5S6QTN7_TRIMR
MHEQNQGLLECRVLEGQCLNEVHPNESNDDSSGNSLSVRGHKVRLLLAHFFWVLTMPISIFQSIAIVPAHTRAVVWRFRKLLSPEGHGPGLIFYNPFCDKVKMIDVRDQLTIVPNQKYVTKDAVTVSTSFVMRIKLINPQLSISTTMNQISLAQTIAVDHLRLLIRGNSLDNFWKARNPLLVQLQTLLNTELASFGLRVVYIGLTNLNIPPYIQEPIVKFAIESRKAIVKEAVLETQLTVMESSSVDTHAYLSSPLMEYVKLFGLQNCSKPLQHILKPQYDHTNTTQLDNTAFSSTT